MKKFNLNSEIYIHITDAGWLHLYNTVGSSYINACIKNEHHEVSIFGKVYYGLQAHQVFSLLPVDSVKPVLFELNIFINEEDLI